MPLLTANIFEGVPGFLTALTHAEISPGVRLLSAAPLLRRWGSTSAARARLRTRLRVQEATSRVDDWVAIAPQVYRKMLANFLDDAEMPDKS